MKKIGFSSFGASSLFRSVSHTSEHTNTRIYIHFAMTLATSYIISVRLAFVFISSFHQILLNIANCLSFFPYFFLSFSSYLWMIMKREAIFYYVNLFGFEHIILFQNWSRLSFGPFIQKQQNKWTKLTTKKAFPRFFLSCLIWCALCVCFLVLDTMQNDTHLSLSGGIGTQSWDQTEVNRYLPVHIRKAVKQEGMRETRIK